MPNGQTELQLISRPNCCTVQPTGFRQAADQVRILYRLAGCPFSLVIDKANGYNEMALGIGRVADEGQVRAGGPLGVRWLVGHANECPPLVEPPGRVQALLGGGAAAAVD